MFGERADTAGELGHHGGAVVGHRQRKCQAGRAAGGVRAAIGGVDGEKCQHPAQDCVFVFVRQVAVDGVHRRAEQHLMDGPTFGFVGRTGIHLIQRLGRCAHLESAQRFRRPLAPSDQLGHARDRFGAVFLAEMHHQLHRIAVEDHRLLTGLADIDRHHFRVDGRKGVQAELFGDLGGGGELHRSRDLVAESVDELDRRGHSTAIGVGLQTQRAQARTLQDGRRRQAVVPGSDNDRVIVSHGSDPFPRPLRRGPRTQQNMSVLTY